MGATSNPNIGWAVSRSTYSRTALLRAQQDARTEMPPNTNPNTNMEIFASPSKSTIKTATKCPVRATVNKTANSFGQSLQIANMLNIKAAHAHT